ncbi:MAG: hypothetical protein K2O61_04550 [Bacteroidaceae bacterium]|nr:hypothetical protein [Bacteroidaceae bacterium]
MFSALSQPLNRSPRLRPTDVPDSDGSMSGTPILGYFQRGIFSTLNLLISRPRVLLRMLLPTGAVDARSMLPSNPDASIL